MNIQVVHRMTMVISKRFKNPNYFLIKDIIRDLHCEITQESDSYDEELLKEAVMEIYQDA